MQRGDTVEALVRVCDGSLLPDSASLPVCSLALCLSLTTSLPFFKSCVLLSEPLSQMLHQCSTQATFGQKPAAGLKLESLFFLSDHFFFPIRFFSFIPGRCVFLFYSLLLIIKVSNWCWFLHLCLWWTVWKSTVSCFKWEKCMCLCL